MQTIHDIRGQPGRRFMRTTSAHAHRVNSALTITPVVDGAGLGLHLQGDGFDVVVAAESSGSKAKMCFWPMNGTEITRI